MSRCEKLLQAVVVGPAAKKLLEVEIGGHNLLERSSPGPKKLLQIVVAWGQQLV